MTFAMNDKRHVTPESPSVTEPLHKIAETDPEKTFQVVVGALKDYVKRRSKVEKDKSGKEWTRGIMIPNPDHEIVEEIARYVVEGLIKGADARTWTMVCVAEMRPGDVFTRYVHHNGKPMDQEVTVVSSKPSERAGINIVKFSCSNGSYGELKAAPDYLFYIHRPSAKDVFAELEE